MLGRWSCRFYEEPYKKQRLFDLVLDDVMVILWNVQPGFNQLFGVIFFWIYPSSIDAEIEDMSNLIETVESPASLHADTFDYIKTRLRSLYDTIVVSCSLLMLLTLFRLGYFENGTTGGLSDPPLSKLSIKKLKS